MADLERLALSGMVPDLRTALTPRVDRLGYLGEFFQCTANAPDVLLSFMRFSEAAARALPTAIVELVALTVAVSCGNDYERNQHERLCLRSGLDRSWVQRVEALTPEGLSEPAQEAVQRYVTSTLAGDSGSAAAAWAALLDVLPARQAVAVMFLTGRSMAHSLIVKTLELAPPVPSVFEDGFSGD